MLVRIKIDDFYLEGDLEIPENAQGIVIFAHGSGSSRFSPRNNYVAKVLVNNGIAALLTYLLNQEEDLLYENRFNIKLLTERLVLITKWIKNQPETKNLNIGYFGASTGAAAALKAAAKIGPNIKAVVSRGGRADLAIEDLDKVQSPVLLIVGGYDDIVIDFNKQAYNKLSAIKALVIIPEASHLFEEPGKLEEVAQLAAEWFKKELNN
jgi:putative phosphoribosyl transferase